MPKVTDVVENLIRPVVEGMGIMIWDIEFIKEGGEHYLRVFIDKEGGISIDDCEMVSRAIDPLLDEADPIDHSYILEVSSPGIERVLKRPGDFERFMGEKVEVRLFSAAFGKKIHRGLLSGYSNGDVTIDEDGEPRTYQAANISRVKTLFDF